MDSILTTSIPIVKRLSVVSYLKSVLLLILFTSLIGCEQFRSDRDEEVPEPAITIAPTAEFSASIVTGTAPVAVTFTDNSTSGTSIITSWQWDFGDGDSSTEQNPQHTYDIAGSYSVTLTVTSADGNDSETKNSLITVDAALVSIKITALDIKGALLEDVIIESTDFDIFQQQVEPSGVSLSLNPSIADGIMKVSKPGYLSNYIFMEGVTVDQTMLVVLKEKSEPIIFNGFNGGKFYGEDGTGVEIPSESIVRADGSTVTGDVELYITPIDISDERELGAFPGSYYGTNGVGEPQDSLFSYGVFDITFEENGVELQLAENSIAVLTLPLYATKSFENEDLVIGDVIPLWYLDTETGLWIYESDGQVVADPLTPNGFSLQATTSHFTTFNSDINPPGLGRGDSGGSGGSTDSRVCNMKIDLIGAEIDQSYLYTIVYSRAGWPASKNSRGFVYDGSQIGQNILRGFYVTVTVSKGELEGSTSFFCNGEDITQSITLGDQPPVITDFNLRVEPVFGRNASDISEIISNTIYVGGYWIGAHEGTIASDLLSTPYILSRGIYREVEYLSSDPSQALFSLTVNNDFGEEFQSTLVTYVDEYPPVLGFIYAYYDVDMDITNVYWDNVEGADTLDLYQLEDLTVQLGLKVLPTIILNSTNGEATIQGKFEGYLRFDFSNQFGTSSEFLQISGAECSPFSDICVPAN